MRHSENTNSLSSAVYAQAPHAHFTCDQSQGLVVPRSTVTSQIDSLNEECANLLAAVDRVGECTSYICDQAPPEGVMGNASARAEPPIIDALDSIIGRLRLATARLHGLADRVRI